MGGFIHKYKTTPSCLASPLRHTAEKVGTKAPKRAETRAAPSHGCTWSHSSRRDSAPPSTPTAGLQSAPACVVIARRALESSLTDPHTPPTSFLPPAPLRSDSQQAIHGLLQLLLCRQQHGDVAMTLFDLGPDRDVHALGERALDGRDGRSCRGAIGLGRRRRGGARRSGRRVHLRHLLRIPSTRPSLSHSTERRQEMVWTTLNVTHSNDLT